MTARYLMVRNFERFQHYGDRRPVWIKLYSTLLADYEFGSLRDASKAHAMLIWLLAGQLRNKVPHDATWIGARISATEPVDLQCLIDAGFLVEWHDVNASTQDDASNLLADHAKTASLDVDVDIEEETTLSARPKPEPDGRIEQVLAHYRTRHPKRRPGNRADRTAIARALKTYPVADILAAIDGNARDPWHADRAKHELPYVLRDSGKIDQFIALASPLRHGESNGNGHGVFASPLAADAERAFQDALALIRDTPGGWRQITADTLASLPPPVRAGIRAADGVRALADADEFTLRSKRKLFTAAYLSCQLKPA